MFSNGEILSVIILIIIVIITFVYALDRICKCIEKCKSMKIVDKYIDKNNTNDVNKAVNDLNDALKKGLGK